MSKPGGNPENLITPTSEQARINGQKGGLASAEAKKERKKLSQIYAEYLAHKHDFILRDKDGTVISQDELTTEDFFRKTMDGIISRQDSPSVSVWKELREGTEGSKVALSGPDGQELPKIIIEFVHIDNEVKPLD